MKDKQAYKLFERITETKSVSGIQKATAQWVLDLYDRYEDTLVENAELKEQIKYQEDYIEDNTVDPHAEKMSYFRGSR